MDVLEELTEFEPKIDKEHVERRVQDWESRVESLYGKIIDWLPASWEGTNVGSVLLDEEMMRKFGVKGRKLPSLCLRRSTGEEVRIEPRGLWIIGANGRLDLVRSPAHYIIVDQSGIFERPVWTIASLENRLDRRPFDRDALHGVLT